MSALTPVLFFDFHACQGESFAQDGEVADVVGQQVSQQATLLASLDYFGFLVVVGVCGAALMVAQRILK
jgi:hypothetical protein